MNKKPVEPDEMRMPADKFDEIMRRALDAPLPSEDSKAKPKPKVVKGKKEPRA
jgi:hypothetical protein